MGLPRTLIFWSLSSLFAGEDRKRTTRRDYSCGLSGSMPHHVVVLGDQVENKEVTVRTLAMCGFKG